MPSTNQEHQPVILQLAVPSPLRRIFDYLAPTECQTQDKDWWKPGIRLLVPFGRRQVVAVLVGVSDSSNLPREQLKPALSVLDKEPLFPAALFQTLRWAATYYQHPPGEVFSTALPAKLRQGASTELEPELVWQVTKQASTDLEQLLKRAPRQRALLHKLTEHGPLSNHALREAGFSSAILKNLEERKLVQQKQIERVNPTRKKLQNHAKPSAIVPNQEQRAAIEAIYESLGSFNCHLLDGVTGSGKTEVYMQVIAEVLNRNRQTLVLVPEIGLTPQSIARFQARFDCDIVALHSGLSDTERLTAWIKARSGTAGIIIGTRSAIFTPLARPGLIVIDEEHDASFKQQDGFRYSARDLAIIRAREENINIVLGSATPALESFYNARQGRFNRLELSQRAGNAGKPPISLLDLATNTARDGFSAPLLELISQHLENGNQVLVFINRRGFAPTLACQECGYVFECSRCDAQLTVHKMPASLHCHHCESRQRIPATCINCGSKQLQTRGMGTEKSEQLLQQQFSRFPVLRVDRDSTRRKNALSDRLKQVQSGEPCILVGTQMLAKGHHFPGVTLVAVLDADSGLFSADFRGQEHMIQLLFQVAGRAGRAENPGHVIVQTRNATHSSLQALVDNDYHKIADLLLQEREQAGMPPFSHLALIRAEATQATLPQELLQDVYRLCADLLPELNLVSVELHQPLPAPMEKRAGRFRAQMLIRSNSRGALQKLLIIVCPRIEGLKSARKVRWSVDVDPQDLT